MHLKGVVWPNRTHAELVIMKNMFHLLKIPSTVITCESGILVGDGIIHKCSTSGTDFQLNWSAERKGKRANIDQQNS